MALSTLSAVMALFSAAIWGPACCGGELVTAAGIETAAVVDFWIEMGS
jgi:hypothetical protein